MPSSASRHVLSGTALTGLALSFVLLLGKPTLAESSMARAFCEKVESRWDSRESVFVIQASHWTGGQHECRAIAFDSAAVA